MLNPSSARSWLPTIVPMSLLVLAVLAGCSGQNAERVSGTTTLPAPRPIRTAPTQIEFYNPWPGLALSTHLHISSTLSGGSCRTASLADPDENVAWRCTVGNKIYDPCLTAPLPNPTEVVCADTPYSSVVILKLSKPLAANGIVGNGVVTRPHAWYLILSNGARCGAITRDWVGSVSAALPFECGHGETSDPVETYKRPWIVQYRASGSGTLKDVYVVTAWV
jgi:hypothetical protein